MQYLEVNVKYDVPEGYKVLFEIYLEDPFTIDKDGQIIKRTDLEPTTTAHQLLNSLGFCTRVVVSITFHQVDYAPDTKTGTDCNDQCLKDIDCTAKKSHNHV